MKKHVLWGLGGAWLASVLNVGIAAAYPFAGIDLGATIPISDFRKTADPGGAVAPYVGYRLFGVGNVLDVSLLAQPQAAFFSADNFNDNNSSVMSLTGGARFSLRNEHLEAHFSPQGGYYWGTSAHMNNDGGFNLTGGLDYKLTPETLLGIYIRRDESSINVPGTSDNLLFLVTGLGVQHRFLPPVEVAAAPPPAPQAPTPVVKKRIVLRGVQFDFDKATIRADARPILDEAVSTLKDNSAISVAVEGHTDSVGTAAYNQRLSQRRAGSVRDYLVGHGISDSRLSVAGFSEAQPVASNATADGRAQNRRVELRVTNDGQ